MRLPAAFPCRFENVRSMLKSPLLDPSVPEERLAAWIDSHTMHVHQFLDRLDRVRMLSCIEFCERLLFSEKDPGRYAMHAGERGREGQPGHHARRILGLTVAGVSCHSA